MVVSQVEVRPLGLDVTESLWAAYTTVFIPLSSSLFSSRALRFYLWLKQMKELEQEKDSLLAGLDVLDRAKEWYQTQIHNIMETQRHIGQSLSTASLNGSCQSRLNILLPKLQDVTRCLSDLVSFSATTSPSGTSTSTSVAPLASIPAPPQAIHVLKEQNRLLSQEVSEKSDRIAQLEQEKSALIKQLFEARARNAHDSSALDSTFI